MTPPTNLKYSPSPHKFSKTLRGIAGMVSHPAGLGQCIMLSGMGFGVRWTWVQTPVSLLISIVALAR